MRRLKSILMMALVVSLLITNSASVFSAPRKSTNPSAPTLGYSPTAPTNGTVKVTIYYPSTAIVKQYKFGIDGTWMTYSTPIVLSSNTYVIARYQNNKREWSALGGVTVSNIDKIPPAQPTFSPSTAVPTIENVVVSIDYSNDSTTKLYKVGDGIWTNYTTPITIDSNSTIIAKASDAVGNWSDEVMYVIDNIALPLAPPSIFASTIETTYEPVQLSIIYDDRAIIKQYKIGLDGIWTNYTTPISISNNTTVYAKASDYLGQWSNEVSYTINNITKMVLGYTVKYGATDKGSYNSIVANTNAINEIATATFSVDGLGNLTGIAPTDQITYANDNQITTKLMVSNNFDSNIAKQLLQSPENRTRLTQNILQLLDTYNYKGVDIDIENIPAVCRDDFTAFMSEVYGALKPNGYSVSVAVQAKTNDSPNATWNYAFDYKALAQNSDYLMIMSYDEHYPGGVPGSVASINWVTSVVNYALTVVPKEKIVLGLAAYGYDWSSSATKAYSINGCINLANQYGVPIIFDDVSKSKYFKYTVNGIEHTVWFEDGDTIAFKLDLVLSKELRGVGIWRLGLENSYFWDVIRTKLMK